MKFAGRGCLSKTECLVRLSDGLHSSLGVLCCYVTLYGFLYYRHCWKLIVENNWVTYFKMVTRKFFGIILFFRRSVVSAFLVLTLGKVTCDVSCFLKTVVILLFSSKKSQSMVCTYYMYRHLLLFRNNRFGEISLFSPLNTKRRLLYLKTHFVPRSKHFSSRL